MGDNYGTTRLDDSFPMPVGRGGHNTHYKLSKEEFVTLLQAFSKFISEDIHQILPKVLEKYLPDLIKYCLEIRKGGKVQNPRLVYQWTHILHSEIMHYYYPELAEDEIPTRSSITSHIRGVLLSEEQHEIEQMEIDIKPEIVMVYGEGGIFDVLGERFLNSYKERRRIEITGWEDALLVFGLIDNSNTNSGFVSNKVICKGKFLAIQIMRIFLCNILLYENVGKIFIPEDIYSEQEIAEYFQANFKTTES